MSRHDKKRAARFADRAIGAEDTQYSSTSYVGEGADSCCLCDTKIKYQFRLTFNTPGKAPVVFEPVGSKCITDWMKALPASPERDAAMARVKDAEKVCQRLKREKKAAEKAKNQRDVVLAALDGDGPALMRRFYAAQDHSPDATRDWATAQDIAKRVESHYHFSSDKQQRYFAVVVSKVEAGILVGMTDSEKAEYAEERMVNKDYAGLLTRYYALPSGHRTGTLNDMANGVERFGSFRSAKAARYFSVCLSEAEAEASIPASDDGDVLAVAQPSNMDDFPF